MQRSEPYDMAIRRNASRCRSRPFRETFTDLPPRDGAAGQLPGAEINQAKIVLATEATALLHGRDAATNAKETAKSTFAGGAGDDLPTLSVGGGISILAALPGLGFCASNGEAKRKIAESAVRLDDQLVTDPC